MGRDEAGNSSGERHIYDRHCGADSHDVIQLYDVTRAHPDAPVTRRRTDFPFLRRAVDVNVPPKCVGILRFESTQPQNPSHDWITTRRIGLDNFPGAPTVLEYRARWRITANFFRYLQLPKWRKPAAPPIAETELGSGDGINRHDIAAVEKGQLLFACADHDVMLRVRRSARRDNNWNQDCDPMVQTDRRAVWGCSDRRVACRVQGSSRHGCLYSSRVTLLVFHLRLNLKNFSAVSVVASAISSNGTARVAAIVSATMRVCAGSQRFPRKGTGARYGQSVSTMSFQSGICAATSRTATPFLKVTIPVNETRWSRSRTSFASSSEPPKQ